MIRAYVERGLTAGAVAGLLFGLFVALVGNPLIGHLEGTQATETASHHAGPVVSGTVTGLVSVGGGVLWGLLLGGVVFGVGYYFLEPAIPGRESRKPYVLTGAAFVTVSGAPWLVVPPHPAGVEAGLPTGTRLFWYGIMVLAGALACVLAAWSYRTRGDRSRAVPGALAGLLVLAVPVALAPAAGGVPSVSGEVTALYQASVGLGQVGLWAALAVVHSRLGDPRGRGTPGAAGESTLPSD